MTSSRQSDSTAQWLYSSPFHDTRPGMKPARAKHTRVWLRGTVSQLWLEGRTVVPFWDAFRQRLISLDRSRVSIPLERSYAVHSGAFLRKQKYYLITNSNFWQNIGEHKHTLYSLQPTIAKNEYLFHNSGNIQAIKLSQRISKHNVSCDII